MRVSSDAGLGSTDAASIPKSHPGPGTRIAGSTVLAAVSMAISWLYLLPTRSKVPGSGVDASWIAGLHMVAHDRLQQGTEVMYTYGPLGFLSTTVYMYTVPWLLATAASWTIALALPLVVFWLVRPALPTGVAGVVTTLLVTFAFLYADVALPIGWSITASLLGLGLVVRGQVPRRWMVIGFGAITAGLMLISPVAVTGAALSLLAAAFLPALERNGWRDAAGRVITFAASFAATFLLLWFLTGQTLGGLIPWARYSASIVSGYAAAMNRTGTVFPHAQIVAAVVVVVLTVTVVWWRSSGIPQVRRSGALALYLVLCFLVFKHGFVRQGDGHVLGFFEFAAMAPLAFLPWLRLRLAAALVSFGLVAVLALYLTFGAVFDGWTTIREAADSIARSYAPSPHIESLTDTIHLATSAEERSATAREGRANIVRLSKFPGDLSAFEGQTVHISPWDASLQYALQGTTWDPAPVFQDYAAYTTALDELNADWFDGPDAADVVLRRPGHAIDNRLPRWEPPSATLSILCHYRSGQEMTGWIVLQHLERSRCGEPESAGSAETTMGETFRPPAAMPATLLVARFSGIADGPADRLLATAFRAPEIQVETANSRSWRFLQGTQGSWHVISAPDCALTTLDGGTQLDMSSLRFWSKGGPGTAITEALSDSKIQVEYASIPFSC